MTIRKSISASRRTARQHRARRQTRWLLAAMALLLGAVGGCQSTRDLSTGDARVKIGQHADAPGAQDGRVGREALEDEMRRFADRYMTRMALECNRVIAQCPDDPTIRWMMTGWKVASSSAATDIAIGSNSVESLLDMLVLASLTKWTVESHWTPNVLNAHEPGLGDGLLEAATILEDDVWGLSGRVLTPPQQDELRGLIDDWTHAHPNQIYPWQVRFSGFSGQRAADLAQVKRTGGLLGEVTQASQQAEDIANRVLFVSQRLPGLMRLNTEMAAYALLAQPDVRRVLHNYDELTDTAKTLKQTARDLPELLATTREDTIKDVSDAFEQQREATLEQVRQVVAAERDAALQETAALVSTERDATLQQVSEIVKSEREGAIDQVRKDLFADDASLVNTLFDQIEKEREEIDEQVIRIVNHSARLTGGLIVLTIVMMLAAMLAYRWLAQRLGRSARAAKTD